MRDTRTTLGDGRGLIPTIALLFESLNASSLTGAIATFLISSITIALGALLTALTARSRVPIMLGTCGAAGAIGGINS